MKSTNPYQKSNWQYFWENFVNRVLLPLFWTLVPFVIFAFVILFLSL